MNEVDPSTAATPSSPRRYIAACPEETKDTTVEELRSLGATDLKPSFRAVSFTADDALAYGLHLRLRTASRILRVIKDIPATSPAMLFSQARRIAWPTLFDAQQGFLVEALGSERGGLPSKQVITQVREAIRDVFLHRTGATPKLELEEPKVVIVAHVENGRCVLAFDTCGKALHKRGYRKPGHPAVIKETLAASLLLWAGYDGSQAFLDPMCGSGTIAVEAALIALRRAPQLLRGKGELNLEWLKDFDRQLWRTTQETARREKLEASAAPIVASDINPSYVEVARATALAARVERYMTFEAKAFADCEPPAPTGILVTNLPYGERISTGGGDTRELYEALGDTLKQKFAGWRAAVLAIEDSPYKFIGLKPTRRIPVFNGNIPCRLLIFDLYAGRRTKP